jgi:hypothetical protein
MSSTFRRQCCALFALGVVAACGREAVSAPSETSSALDADAQSVSASRAPDERAHVFALEDDCDPADPRWAPQGCFRKRGDVTRAEFDAFVTSPLVVGMVGHPAWTIDPTYAKLEPGQSFLVANTGGRPHTFTEVAQFGGGRVPPLNVGSTIAPECAPPAPGQPDPTFVAPGTSMKFPGLASGTHKFQCCFHPWMREVVKVGAGGGGAH